MAHIELKRMAQGKSSTLSHLYVNGIFATYLLEDAIRKNKVPGKTCIPEGSYKLLLNTWGGMNLDYRKRYPEMHKGMIEISGIPNFKSVYLHIGNTIHDTAGCPLFGSWYNLVNGEFEVYQSRLAYERIYPVLTKIIAAESVHLTVTNQHL
ncbi:hypothetical protein C3K47_18970 [Solitalea longa]|uniref:DUF5675 domain-containing protein n=1 Tax=Solitalea longa TaxID=2079460 RepID=A0A2S4ZXJ7_9SPHI|nr:DUF5675 family protein [Solitalea longa]POY34717.1 hypothetical protein C3K47_18970 [Solitalea longa]